MSYTTTLEDPASWAVPKLVIAKEQGWYPQVIGAPSMHGTDQLSGSRARYFSQGRSVWWIVFTDRSQASTASRR